MVGQTSASVLAIPLRLQTRADGAPRRSHRQQVWHSVPAQHAIQVALGGRQSVYELTGTGGRLLNQRNIAYEKLNEIPGVSVTKPMGALYAFPRLDPNVYEIHDDAKLMLDILRAEKILLVQGTGFNWPEPDHFRVVTLPWASQLENAIERLGNFLVSYKQ